MGLWNAIKNAANTAVEAVQEVTEAVVESVQQVGEGIQEAVGGAVDQLSGDNGNAWDFKGAASAIAGGLDTAILGSMETLVYGTLDAAETIHQGTTDAVTELLGKKWGDRYDWVTGRIVEGTRSAVTGITAMGTGAVRSATEAGGMLANGVGKLLSGDGSGWDDVGKSFVKMLFTTPMDGFVTLGGQLVSGAQVLVNAEPRGRKLTENEVQELRRVFSDSITYDRIRIKDGSANVFGDRDSSAFVHLYTIYMKSPDPKQYLSTLVHEVTHVWQFENGGTDYMSEAVWSQRHGKGYDWWKSVPGTAWGDLEAEEQAELLEDAYQFSYFRSHTFTRDVDGDGVPDDLSRYMNTAVAQLRAGEGAP